MATSEIPNIICNKISEFQKVSLPLEEVDEDSLKKLLLKLPYTKENISKCAEHLLREHSYDYDQQFGLIDNLDNFEQIFGSLDHTKPILFFICGKGEDRWTLFCLVQDDGNKKTKILYKDSFDATIDNGIEEKIREKMGDVEIVVNTFKEDAAEAGHLQGPMCLRNLRTLLKAFEQDSAKPIDKFRSLKFPSAVKVFNDRLRKSISMVIQLSQNKEFLSTLKKYTDIYPLKACFETINSRKTGTDNQENEAEADHSEKEIDSCEEDLQIKFPEELQNVQIILQILDDVSEEAYKFKLLQNICDLLKLDYDKIKSFFAEMKEENPASSTTIAKESTESGCSLEKFVNKVMEEMDSHLQVSVEDEFAEAIVTTEPKGDFVVGSEPAAKTETSETEEVEANSDLPVGGEQLNSNEEDQI